MLQKKTKTTDSEKTTTKNYIQFFLVVVIVALIYSIRPLTIKFGKRYEGIVVLVDQNNSALKGGNPKTIFFVQNNRIDSLIYRGGITKRNECISVFKNKILTFNLVFAKDNEIKKQNKFLVYSSSIPKKIKQVSLEFENGNIKKIDVQKIKNFGCFVRISDVITVRYNDKIKCKINPILEADNFKELH